MSKPIVAIVGSPNVGKSTIFNRLVGERHAIVDDEAGITRDRLYGNVEWLSHKFAIIDTGGVELKNKPFQEQIRMQVQIAIDEADLIVFVVDGQVGISNDDIMVAKMLRNVKKPVLLVANKIDSYNQISNAHDFYALGLGEPISVSGSQYDALRVTCRTTGIENIGDIIHRCLSLQFLHLRLSGQIITQLQEVIEIHRIGIVGRDANILIENDNAFQRATS